MSQLIFLGFQIAGVILVGWDLDGDAFDNAQAVAVQADDLAGVVGEQADVADAQIVENLGADAVVTQIGAEAEAVVGFDSVEPLGLLELVGLELGQEANALAFLTHVEHDALAGLADLRHGLVELGTAVAQATAEDVTGEALAVNADQHRLGLFGN